MKIYLQQHFLIILVLLLTSPLVYAKNTVGKVIIFSGIVAAKSDDGKVRVLSRKSKVFKNDMISTEKDSYARIRFTDGSILELRPQSTITIDEYYFNKKRPKKDKAVINLLEGGLRTVTGLIGKRGDKDSYQTKTRHSSIGIRGTVYGVLMCQGASCAGLTGAARPQTDGQYVNVSTGAVVVRNSSGEKFVTTGQFAFVSSNNANITISKSDPGGVRFITPEATNTSRPVTPQRQNADNLGCQIK